VEAYALRQWGAGQNAYLHQELARLEPRESAA
jgi:hypothetical protein